MNTVDLQNKIKNDLERKQKASLNLSLLMDKASDEAQSNSLTPDILQ